MKQSDNPEERQLHREQQMEALRFDMSLARPIKEIVWEQIKLGVDVKYLALRYGCYGFTVESLQKAKETHDAREAIKAERVRASQGPG